MRQLKQAEIEQALGRQALIAELRECETRGREIAGKASVMEGPPEKISRLAGAAERMDKRAAELIEILWGDASEPKGPGWVERFSVLAADEVRATSNALLREHPEKTPPDEDTWGDDEALSNWLAQKLAGLTPEDRDRLV